jgi:hypothetical protein
MMISVEMNGVWNGVWNGKGMISVEMNGNLALISATTTKQYHTASLSL